MKKLIFIVILLITFLTGCQKCTTLPFFMQIRINDLNDIDLLGKDFLAVYKLDSIYFYYIKDGLIQKVHHQHGQDVYNNRTENYLFDIALQDLVVDKKINTYFLYLNTNTIDTFTIKAHSTSKVCDTYKVDEFKVNNIDFMNKQNIGVNVGTRKYYLSF